MYYFQFVTFYLTKDREINQNCALSIKMINYYQFKFLLFGDMHCLHAKFASEKANLFTFLHFYYSISTTKLKPQELYHLYTRNGANFRTDYKPKHYTFKIDVTAPF